MSMKTRKKHKNQNKDTQDCPRLDAGLSRQSSRQDNTSVLPGNWSGAGSEGGDELTIGGTAPSGGGNRQGNRGGNY